MKNLNKNITVAGYRLCECLGQGTFSKVWKAENIKTKINVAIKVMKNEFKSIEQVERLRELQALKRLRNHSNIIQLQEILFDESSGKLALVFELMAMNLYEYVSSRKKKLKENTIKNYMYQLIKSIEHMHSCGIFHRDIKPENILILGDQLKLADFGSCKGCFSRKPFTEYISTRWYRSPECLLTDGYYEAKMDLWGVGCVFYETITFQPLFPGENELDQIKKIHSVLGTPDQSVLEKFKRYAANSNISFSFPYQKGKGLAKLLAKEKRDCVDLLKKLLVYNPEKRITAKKALKHPYFKEVREKEKIEKLKSERRNEKRFSEIYFNDKIASIRSIGIPKKKKRSPSKGVNKSPSKARSNQILPKIKKKRKYSDSVLIQQSSKSNSKLKKIPLKKKKISQQTTQNNHNMFENLSIGVNQNNNQNVNHSTVFPSVYNKKFVAKVAFNIKKGNKQSNHNHNQIRMYYQNAGSGKKGNFRISGNQKVTGIKCKSGKSKFRKKKKKIFKNKMYNPFHSYNHQQHWRFQKIGNY